jgi:hypothetical protein
MGYLVQGGAPPDASVSTDKVVDDAITGAKIADDAIDSEHYVDGSIDPAHLADDAVTLAKMAGGTDGNLISYDTNGDVAAVATGDSGQILTSNGAGAAPTFQAAAGGGGFTEGTLQSPIGDADFTGLPSGTKMIVVSFQGVSQSSIGEIRVQIGDSGGFETSSYSSSSIKLTASSDRGLDGWSFNVRLAASDAQCNGQMILALMDSATNLWSASHAAGDPNARSYVGGGTKALSGELTQLRITKSSGSFDAGAVNIMYM